MAIDGPDPREVDAPVDVVEDVDDADAQPDMAVAAAQPDVAAADPQRVNVVEVLVTFDDVDPDKWWRPKMRVEIVDANGTTRGMTPKDMREASHELRADTASTVLMAIRDHEIPDTVDDPEAYVREQLTNWSLEAFMDDFYATRFRVALEQFEGGEHADSEDSDFDGDGIFPSDVSEATARWDAFTARLGQ